MAVLNNTAMECAGDVTLGRVRATDVVGDMQKVLHILIIFYSFRYTACNSHVPYYVVFCCPAPLRSALQNFPTLSHKRHDLRKKNLHKICAFISSTTLCAKYFVF